MQGDVIQSVINQSVFTYSETCPTAMECGGDAKDVIQSVINPCSRTNTRI
jgi:hypothetical protein